MRACQDGLHDVRTMLDVIQAVLYGVLMRQLTGFFIAATGGARQTRPARLGRSWGAKPAKPAKPARHAWRAWRAWRAWQDVFPSDSPESSEESKTGPSWLARSVECELTEVDQASRQTRQ